MTPERYAEACTTGKLTQEEIDEGYHFCLEWDLLLIHRDDPEFDVCICFTKEAPCANPS